jgi:Phosphotransferase enzyme family
MTAAEAIAQVNEAHGVAVTVGDRCPGGEVGAYYATDERGRLLVFKWSDDPRDAGYFASIQGRVQRLADRGYPVPCYLTPIVVPGGVVLFQVAVPGTWRDDVDVPLVATAVRLVEMQADAATEDDTGWTAYIRATLTDGADGYCLHEPLRYHSEATKDIVQWVEAVGRRLVSSLPDRDLVHIDFQHRNMLRREDGRLTAVIDWEGCRPGDRAFDLVTFCFGMTHAVGSPAVFDRAWNQATQITTPEALRAYVAHMALRRTDWTIRHHPADVNHVVAVAQAFRDRVA